MNENIDIFVLSHKDFTPSVTNPIYKIMNLGGEHNIDTKLEVYNDNTLDSISDMNFTYNENTGIYWLWKNYQDHTSTRLYPTRKVCKLPTTLY